MKRKLTIIGTLAAVGSTCWLGIWWYWQANYNKSLVSIDVPMWIAGGGNVSYSVAIHKSQIHPYGTIWRKTYGDGWISNFPIR